MKHKWLKILNVIHAYWDLLLARSRQKAMPTELSIGTTSFCNLKCVMCPREGSDGNLTPFDDHIDMEYFVALEPYLKRAREISLYGLGEPMIDRGYFEKVKYVSSFGGDVSLSSNGTLLDDKRCNEVIDSGIAAMGISLDASCEDTFKVVRPPGGFDDIVENIKRLTRIRKERGVTNPLLKLSFGIMKQNIQDVERFPDIAKAVGADEIIVHPIIYQSKYHVEHLAVPREQLEAEVEKARVHAESYGIPFHFWDLDNMTFLRSVDYYNEFKAKQNDKPKCSCSDESANGNGNANLAPPKKGKPKSFCFFLWRNAMVQGKGEVFPCCYMSNIKVGQFEDGNLNEIRNHDVIADLRQRIYDGDYPEPCQGCPQMHPYDRKHIIKSGLQEIRNMVRTP